MKFIADPDMIGLEARENTFTILRRFSSQGFISLEKRGELLLHSDFVISFFKEFLAAEAEIGFRDGILQQVALLSKGGACKRQNNDGKNKSHSHRRILTSFRINAKLNSYLRLLSDKHAFS